MITDVAETLVHGLTLGSMYAMVAAGLALMLGVARLINFAHGEFFMLGAYAFWFGYSEHALPYPVAGALYQYLKFSVGAGYGWFVGWFYGIALLVTVASVVVPGGQGGLLTPQRNAETPPES